MSKYSYSEDKWICHFLYQDMKNGIKNNRVFDTLDEGIDWGFDQVQEYSWIHELPLEDFIRRSEDYFSFDFALNEKGGFGFSVRKIRIKYYE